MKRFEDIKIHFGKYKGIELKNIPDDYLLFIYNKGISRGKIKVYTQWRLNLPKNKYHVTVTDSVNTDGTYFVEAWNPKHAISEVKKSFKIQITQSFHGTEFDVKLI